MLGGKDADKELMECVGQLRESKESVGSFQSMHTRTAHEMLRLAIQASFEVSRQSCNVCDMLLTHLDRQKNPF